MTENTNTITPIAGVTLVAGAVLLASVAGYYIGSDILSLPHCGREAGLWGSPVAAAFFGSTLAGTFAIGAAIWSVNRDHKKQRQENWLRGIRKIQAAIFDDITTLASIHDALSKLCDVDDYENGFQIQNLEYAIEQFSLRSGILGAEQIDDLETMNQLVACFARIRGFRHTINMFCKKWLQGTFSEATTKTEMEELAHLFEMLNKFGTHLTNRGGDFKTIQSTKLEESVDEGLHS